MYTHGVLHQTITVGLYSRSDLELGSGKWHVEHTTSTSGGVIESGQCSCRYSLLCQRQKGTLAKFVTKSYDL